MSFSSHATWLCCSLACDSRRTQEFYHLLSSYRDREKHRLPTSCSKRCLWYLDFLSLYPFLLHILSHRGPSLYRCLGNIQDSNPSTGNQYYLRKSWLPQNLWGRTNMSEHKAVSKTKWHVAVSLMAAFIFVSYLIMFATPSG